MNTELETAPDDTENRVRTALAELARYTAPPRGLSANSGHTGPESGGEGVPSTLASNRRRGFVVDPASDPKPTSADAGEFQRHSGRFSESGSRRGGGSILDLNEAADRSRRLVAVAAALLLLVGGVTVIAWRQRTQSAAQVATAPSAPPTAASSTVDPSVSGDPNASSIPGGTPTSSSVENAVTSPDATTATNPAPSDAEAPSSGMDPNGATSTDSGVTPNRTILVGATGEDVFALQNRLSELGFVVGSPDGVYGMQTVNAVWAFQTLVLGTPLDAVTDDVTPELWSAIQAPVTITPRRPNAATSRHIEIYLPEQVLVVFDGATPRLITHVSTGELDEAGNPRPYCERILRTVDANGAPLAAPVPGEACGVAKTPGGVFEIHRMEAGRHESERGDMWNPVYFNHGIAIHGALEVPLRPASRGGVQVDQMVGRAIQSLVAVGDEVAVWNDQQDPDQVSEADPLPDFRFTPDDPNDVEGPPPGAIVIGPGSES